ncbi:hypothetical protein RTG_01757 [Rhodotorula toruloides ATCC 204091]|uniref:Cation efflux family-domain containing protein n=1 Tax=Rhodotorula toruloides TaxID=5286 RepID=A0A0K3CM75_RHOTO|nr:hypothetical protein RTG_01757 [Rhodotorula toruloides ATCC 204091]KAK4330143.1 Cation efflux family-domain containing protein [Rhodotorula toruloides]PRQ71737.1 Cation efflux family-domain containing protein [Rhodotorula toruloides]
MHRLDPLNEEDEGPHSSSASTSLGSSSTATNQGHARQHSRIHARNLSAFFPHPGQTAEGYGGTFDDPFAKPFQPGVVDMPSLSSPVSNNIGRSAGETPTKAQSRRGHHHRHSVSHDLFTSRPAERLPSPTTTRTSPKAPEDQLPAPTATFRQRYGRLPLVFRLFLYTSFHVPLATRALLLLAAAQIVAGAALWVQGQAGESLASTGLGYLVVFDGIGAVSTVLLERDGGLEAITQALGSQRNNSVRRPYGSTRYLTLSHFAQAVYLLFSAVYVCKESVEHVLLLHGPEEADGAHAAGHGGVGHGEGLATLNDSHGVGISLPRTALTAAAVLAVALAVLAQNHHGLAAAVRPGILSSPTRTTRSDRPSAFQQALNPFSMTTLLFAIALLGSAAVLPLAQLAPFDKVLALLESVAIFYIAQPAATSTGQALLQTSSSLSSEHARQIANIVRDVEALPTVVSVSEPHIWQLCATEVADSAAGLQRTVVTLTVKARQQVSDPDMLEIVRFAQERVDRANSRREGELDLTVDVRRAQ